MKHTKATKQRLSRMRKGENNPFFGKKHTPETKAKLAKVLRTYRANRQFSLTAQTVKLSNDESIIYLAGMVDADGSIRFVKKKYPFIAVYNTNKELMKWLVSEIGGKIGGKDNRGRKPSYQWRVYSIRNIYALCKRLLPYLKVKREDGIIVIKFIEEKYGPKL